MTVDPIYIDAVETVTGPHLRVVADGPRVIDLVRPSQHCRYRSWSLAAKWLFDRVVGVVALVVTLPVLIVVGAVVAVSSRGPVLFAQKRIGRHGRPFTIYKFRTMRADAEAYLVSHPELAEAYRENDFKLAIHEDVRITGVGRFLRRSSLDELPQLINIVKGDMSLVGPRPVVADELAEYAEYRPMYEAAYPGLTGAWQVGGRECLKYPARAELDAEYVEGWSVRGDLAIMVRTLPALLDLDRTA
jgi:lipopolysaccharide/colanic/teichoic acid biosynthesis glycosyltransferase